MKDEEYNKNERAEKIVGKRDLEGKQPFDEPPKLGYHCPVCKYELETDGNYDERLEWSEYNGFIWCSVCNKDYPTVLCIPDIDRATDIYSSFIEELLKGKAA